MTAGRFSTWLHRKLLRFYPAEFRDEFGPEMARDFDRELNRRGPRTAWRRTFTDWLVSMPREQFDVTRGDLRICLRGLARSPMFTLVVVLSLAIGISVMSVVFTLANSLLIQTPLKEPSRFVGVLRGDGLSEPASWGDFVDYRARTRSFTGFTALNIMPVFLGRGQQSASVMAETVTDNYFDVLDLKPYAGRLFTVGSCPSVCAQEVVLSHRFWKTNYGGDPGIIGRQLPLGGVPATIIGVAPDGFDGALAPVMTDIWIHVENRRLTNPELFGDRRIRWVAMGGRLKDGVSREQAIAELNAIDAQLRRENRYADNEDRHLWASVTRGVGVPFIRARIQMVVALLGTIAGLVLLISCANVANMVLARATAQRQEVAMRRALGARSFQLVRLSLTETLVLALVGGGAGLALSAWITHLFPNLQPPANDLYTYRIALHQDARVYLFTLGVSLVSGILCGIIPALQVARSDCMQAIRNLDQSGRPRLFASSMLVSCQVAFSVLMLVTAGLFYRSFTQQAAITPGVPTANGLVVPLNLNLASYTGNEAKGRRFYTDVKERVRSMPGVVSAGLTSYVPLNATAPAIDARIASGVKASAGLDLIDEDYLATMSVPLLAGRKFDRRDRTGSEPVALADERLVQQLWPEAANTGGAVGQSLQVGEERTPVRVIGVVASDFRPSVTGAPRPMLFLPIAQRYSSMLYLTVRTASAPETFMQRIGRAVESVDDTVSVRRMRTFSTQVADALWPIRTGTRAIAWTSVVAVLLAVFGLYGVIAYSVARRKREMGIRVALGAGLRNVLELIARQGSRMTIWGIAIGLPLAAGANFVLARTLYGVRPADPLVWLGAAALWVLISLVACFRPAWRAVQDAASAIRDAG